jgi:parvulin-like peptidyl-prolyl isomerase
LSFTLLVSLLLAAAPAESPTAATVDGVRISQKEVADRRNARRQRGDKVGVEAVAASLVDEVLLAAEAERRKLPLPPPLAAQVDEARRRIAGRVYEEQMLEGITPDEETLKGVFHLNADSVRFKLVLLPTMAAGKEARDRIEKGGTFLAESKRSLNPESVRLGGDMGLRSRGQLSPDLARVVFAAPLDALHGPVALDLGFAVVQVTARTIGTDAEYLARRDKIVAFARQQMRGSTRKHLTDQLRAREKVKLDEAFLLSTGGSTDLAQGDKVIATVAGRSIRYRDLLAYINEVFQGKPQGHAFGASVKVEMASTMIDDALLEAEAVRSGIDKLPAVEAEVAPLRREALATAMAEALKASPPPPAEAELEAWYQAHLAEYRVPASRRCRAIVVQTPADAAAVRGRLEAGEPFPAVARAVSLDAASAALGGDVGEISFDTLAAMERDPNQAPLARAFRTTPATQLTGPIPAGGAQYLLRCEAIRPERVRELAEVRPEVLARFRGEAGQRAYDTTLARLRAAARISIDREAVLRAAPSSH